MRPGYFSTIGCVWLLTLGNAMGQDTKLSLSVQQRGERDFSKAIALDTSVTAFHDNFRKAGGVEQVQGPAPPDDALYTARSPRRPQQALERPLPTYDVDKHCDELAGFGSSYSYSFKNMCIEWEQESYNELVGIWPGLPYNVADHCTDLGSYSTGSYSFLKSCTEWELQARSETRHFRSAP